VPVAPRIGTGAAAIRPRQVTATADNDGRFALEGLPSGTFRISAQKIGYSMLGEDAFRILLPNAGIAVGLHGLLLASIVLRRGTKVPLNA
jgi:hypothetical protein